MKIPTLIILILSNLTLISQTIDSTALQQKKNKRFVFTELAMSLSDEYRISLFDIDYNTLFNSSILEKVYWNNSIEYENNDPRITGFKIQLRDTKNDNNFEIGINAYSYLLGSDLVSEPYQDADSSIFKNYYSYGETRHTYEVRLGYKRFIHRSADDRFRSYFGCNLAIPFASYSNITYSISELTEEEYNSETILSLDSDRCESDHITKTAKWNNFYTIGYLSFGIEYAPFLFQGGKAVSIYSQASISSIYAISFINIDYILEFGLSFRFK